MASAAHGSRPSLVSPSSCFPPLALDDEASALRIRRNNKAHDDGPNSSTIAGNILIFDIGGCSIRAGFAEPDGMAWPSLYMPSIVANYKGDQAGRHAVGCDALLPEVRSVANLVHPFRQNLSVDRRFDVASLEPMYASLFQQLGADPTEKQVILTEPQFLTASDRVQMAEMMMETFNVPSFYMKNQTLMSLYSYGATSGVIVDIGDRTDIVPVDQGYVIEKGISSRSWGGAEITEQLARMMSEKGHRFFSEVES